MVPTVTKAFLLIGAATGCRQPQQVQDRDRCRPPGAILARARGRASEMPVTRTAGGTVNLNLKIVDPGRGMQGSGSLSTAADDSDALY